MFCGARCRNLVNNCDKGDSPNMDINLSTYAKCLSVDHRKRYIEKISKLNLIDPYDMKKTGFDYGMDLLPKVVYSDVVNYLLFAPSPCTTEQLKCFESINNYFVSGVLSRKLERRFLVTYVYLLGGSVLPKS